MYVCELANKYNEGGGPHVKMEPGTYQFPAAHGMLARGVREGYGVEYSTHTLGL